jgi:hypothetical protein
MSIQLYMDVHVPYAITAALRLHGVDVLTAQDDNTTTLPDARLLDRATALDRVLFSQDEDLLSEATERQEFGTEFAGLIYIHQQKTIVGRCIQDLELIAGVYSPQDIRNRIEYLPLK